MCDFRPGVVKYQPLTGRNEPNKMLRSAPSEHPQFGFFDLMQQLDPNHELLALANIFNWKELETAFSKLYSHTGRGAKPIRLMTGLLILNSCTT